MKLAKVIEISRKSESKDSVKGLHQASWPSSSSRTPRNRQGADPHVYRHAVRSLNLTDGPVPPRHIHLPLHRLILMVEVIERGTCHGHQRREDDEAHPENRALTPLHRRVAAHYCCQTPRDGERRRAHSPPVARRPPSDTRPRHEAFWVEKKGTNCLIFQKASPRHTYSILKPLKAHALQAAEGGGGVAHVILAALLDPRTVGSKRGARVVTSPPEFTSDMAFGH